MMGYRWLRHVELLADLGDVHLAVREQGHDLHTRGIRDSLEECAVIDFHIPYTTTVSGAAALVMGIQELAGNELGVNPVQYFTHPGR